MFQIATENKNTSRPKKQDEYLMIDSRVAKNGIAYLNSELEKGYPVMVGVDYEFDRKIKLKSGKIDYPNTDKTTDHFIVIVGRKYDDKGDLYYLFYEVGVGENIFFVNKTQKRQPPFNLKELDIYKKKGISNENKLYLRNETLLLKGKNSNGRNYVVTEIRVNEHKNIK